jgi:hypothetical protein
MIDGKPRHSLRFGQPHVDRDPTPTLFARFAGSPIGHAATYGTEMKLERFASDVGSGRARDIDAFAFKVIGPKDAVPTAYGAIARRN